ncbi:hypothetical protein PYCCODRAFT_553552 [Trametes coccinea BRFM310]|uniref:Uncharacterized protein n=1 Tax=Trametes coccinea (strain BRFM310) TaxID=1353009 RepID=A0A1Y2IKR0_TRAC3|nr:hypothetical protein PYCCODRAFT_553552 [Trametes coccinea BRFM310]
MHALVKARPPADCPVCTGHHLPGKERTKISWTSGRSPWYERPACSAGGTVGGDWRRLRARRHLSALWLLFPFIQKKRRRGSHMLHASLTSSHAGHGLRHVLL